MQLIVHRGTHEIGGTCIEVTTGTTRIVVDAGLPLVDAEREPFDQRGITGKPIGELIAGGTVPNVSGLFTDGPPVDAILLSHSHLDHSGLLHLTRSEVPIHASTGTSKMMLATAVFGGQRQLDRARHREIRSGLPFQIGNIRITPYAVDHSAFGSLAFLIEAENRRLLYSGDLRNHGRKPGMLQSLINSVQQTPIDVLLMEGTHLGSERARSGTEYDLEDEIVEHAGQAPALVLASFSPIDVDRLVTYYRATRRTGRVFVADAYTAFVMHLVSREASVPSPNREAAIRVYFNRHFEQRGITSISDRFAADRIVLDEILAEPDRFLMVFRPSMRALDFGGTLPARSRCLYSYWQGYLERGDWTRLREHLADTGGDFFPAHTSGHIFVDDLVEFVRAVNPKTVIPIHTFAPDELHRHLPNVRVLNDGETYEVASGGPA